MRALDHAWIDQNLRLLDSISSRPSWRLFRPTKEIYARLESGEETDLQDVTDMIGRHLNLLLVPQANYEWGLKLPSHAAGMIRAPGTKLSSIDIPFSCVGKPLLIGAILAHELSHQLLALNGIWHDDEEENERLTDLAAFATGLGKLVLNGMCEEANGEAPTALVLGYLTPELNIYAYRTVNSSRLVSRDEAQSDIASDVVLKVRGDSFEF
jgi:hypothetical protein